jgi:hypothetical protein
MIFFRLEVNNFVGKGGNRAPKSPSYFTFQKKKRRKLNPILLLLNRPQGIAILWGQPLKIPSNFIFEEINKY